MAAWNGFANTPPEIFAEVIESMIFEHLSALQMSDSSKKIVLTTPINYGAILIAIAQYYGQEPSPADIEEDAYATLYAEIIHEKANYANSQGLNIAVADFNALYKQVASYPGIEIQGIPLNLGTIDLVIDQYTLSLTDFSGALHAYIVIDAINGHYGATLPLPDLTSY